MVSNPECASSVTHHAMITFLQQLGTGNTLRSFSTAHVSAQHIQRRQGSPPTRDSVSEDLLGAKKKGLRTNPAATQPASLQAGPAPGKTTEFSRNKKIFCSVSRALPAGLKAYAQHFWPADKPRLRNNMCHPNVNSTNMAS